VVATRDDADWVVRDAGGRLKIERVEARRHPAPHADRVNFEVTFHNSQAPFLLLTWQLAELCARTEVWLDERWVPLFDTELVMSDYAERVREIPTGTTTLVVYPRRWYRLSPRVLQSLETGANSLEARCVRNVHLATGEAEVAWRGALEFGTDPEPYN
jgi:hypothetical protein